MKTCKDCKQSLLEESFPLYSTNKVKDHRRGVCNYCYIHHKKKAYTKQNQGHTGTVYKRDWWYRSKYGITVEEYEILLKKQNGVCAICGRPPKVGGKRLAVDHCHKTKAIRGLLCRHCNYGLGWFHDNYESLLKASHYLMGGNK